MKLKRFWRLCMKTETLAALLVEIVGPRSLLELARVLGLGPRW
jgi:hypothetical protein